MFVNGLPFLVTSSRGLSLVTIGHLPLRTAKRLVQTIERVFRIYSTAGFIIQITMMDIEFEKLRPLMPQVALNTTATREHVGEIEQKIRVIKERARGTFNTLPYKKIPRVMTIELLHFCVMWMNSFPVKSGISEKWSPRELVSRTKLDAKLHSRAPFGSYCECIMIQTSRILWNQGQIGLSAWDQRGTCKGATSSCHSRLERW